MPEGPEIFILSLALQKLGFCCDAYGKHLYFPLNKEDWSFGLSGTIYVSDNLIQHKFNTYIPGKIQENITSLDELKQKNKLGINWLTSTESELQTIITNKWANKKAKLGSLLLQQSFICGIGVAYGSDILYHAKLNPNISANQQNLNSLATSMIYVRNSILNQYQDYLTHCNNNNNKLQDFCNQWFHNLYQIRTMIIYKNEKASIIKVGDRKWYT